MQKLKYFCSTFKAWDRRVALFSNVKLWKSSKGTGCASSIRFGLFKRLRKKWYAESNFLSKWYKDRAWNKAERRVVDAPAFRPNQQPSLLFLGQKERSILERDEAQVMAALTSLVLLSKIVNTS